MLDIARKVLLLLGLFHGPQALATEATDVPLAPGIIHTHVLVYLERDNLADSAVRPIATTGIGDDWQEATLRLEFQNSSALGRIRGIRGLSLLTLAETKGSRLFLGLNKRGLFGLHINSTRQGSADRVVEIARMPYLDRDESFAALTR